MSAAGGIAAATHIPVLANRILELLTPALSDPGSIYVDGTLGLGGHARLVLTACPNASLIGIDRDPNALAIAAERLADFGDRVKLFQAVYHELPDVLHRAGTSAVQAILLDLGLSSLQIDATARGFAYATDAPLDMRMTPSQELSAATIINTWSEAELARILREFGDERFATRIAAAIVAARATKPFQRSGELVPVIADALPVAARHTGGHPAKRTFQALRIVVNDELGSLSGVLPAALDALAPAGRLAVLAYHSGEDRLVKRAFAKVTTDRVPVGVPEVPPEYRARFRLLTRGAERPSPTETTANPRAASARLRAVIRNPEVN
jgi:16S rRNA (cytosine1402-N4)-methyltransferase